MKQDELTRGQNCEEPMKQGPVEKGQNGSGLIGIRPNWLRTNWEDPDGIAATSHNMHRSVTLYRSQWVVAIPSVTFFSGCNHGITFGVSHVVL